MSAGRAPPASLRPFLAKDLAACAEIFRASVAELADEDYNDDQRAAWISAIDDTAAFGARLSGALTLIATVSGAPVGFASLKDATLDMLYVAPAFARRGIGAMLIEALVTLATARGLGKLTCEASDCARASFDRQGFVAERRNMVRLGGEWLANTTMTKRLTSLDEASSTR